jgi:threonyl-tRNA synthetase
MAEQLESEIVKVMNMIDRFYKKVFNFNYNVELSTRPEKRIGTKATWDKAENILKKVLKKKKIKYKINKGDGAFYGPKIDFHIKDSLKRTWQLATIQLDFAMPERFDLTYEGKDGKKHRPIMLHRVIYGALERFIGILLEHTGGRLPLWLAPIQVRVLSFTKKNIKAAKKVFEDLKKEKIRVDLDLDGSPIAGRVRNAELQKIPYIVVIGDKEEKAKTLAVRSNNKIKFGIKKDSFIKNINKEIQERK